ncbi:MAG: Wzt carbohydrate-binding domain-containing protein, partial [Silvanigrellaceae bacterium]|nr:Wzt carbohydrate-binding domain-containing protein [Silvanigrellaceae bacterium]
AAVKVLCDKVSLLSHGKLIYTGEPIKALELYNALLAEHKASEALITKQLDRYISANNPGTHSGTKKIEIIRTELFNESGAPAVAFLPHTKIFLKVTAKVNSAEIINPTCGILIRDRLSYDIFGVNTYNLGIESGVFVKGDSIVYEFTLDLHLGCGYYYFTVALHSAKTHLEENYDWKDQSLHFQVLQHPQFESIGVAMLNPTCSVRKLSTHTLP